MQAEQAHEASAPAPSIKSDKLGRRVDSHRGSINRRFVYATAADGDALGRKQGVPPGSHYMQTQDIIGYDATRIMFKASCSRHPFRCPNYVTIF